MFNSVLFLQIKNNFANSYILTKTNFELFFTAGKSNTFSVFQVESGKIQTMLWFYVFSRNYNLG